MRVIIDTDRETLTVCGDGATLKELARLEGLLLAHYGGDEWRVVPGIGSVYEVVEDCSEPVPVPDGDRWEQTVCSA